MGIERLQNYLNYHFKNKDLLLESLTHKSYKQKYDNERLEFLGDAVLDLIIGEYLYIKFPKSAEGELSKLRSNLVSEKAFTKLANFIGLGDYIFLSLAEEKNDGRSKASILSDTFEALMGAIYLEGGIKVVQDIVHKLLDKAYDDITMDSLFSDYKTALQELTQARFGEIPEYFLEQSFGPDHQKIFEISIILNEKKYATAKGKSKKDAQQKVAKIVFEQLTNH